MTKSYKRGFTLIELLVVIAIIGLLAAVVLASLGTARTKGADASVKSQLDNMRSAGELFSSNNGNSYAGVCTANSTAANPGLNTMLSNAASSTNSTVSLQANPTTAAETGTSQVVCGDAAGAWVAQAPLTGTNGYWCVDNTGASKAEPAVLALGSTHCL